jgi:Cu/Ag efflux protein CusF
MKTLTIACMLAAALTATAMAQQKADNHAARPPGAAAAATEMTEGEVRKIDKDTRKLTIKHGEIRNLDMPPMTMVFQIKDEAMLDGLKAGDKIRFVVEKTPGGFVVTDVRLAP